MPKIIFPTSPTPTPVNIVSQPKGQYGWVSSKPNEMTEFSQAKEYNGINAYLAHSYMAGGRLKNLKIGDEIDYQTNDYAPTTKSPLMKRYRVKEIRRYQALEPRSELTPLLDLYTNKQRRAQDVAREVYSDPNRMVFQTCIEKGQNRIWGRMFVIAEPE